MKRFRFCLLWFAVFVLGSCSFAMEPVPYSVKGEMLLDSEDYPDTPSFNYEFRNRSDKEIKAFTLVFYLFDEEGNPPDGGRSNVIVTVEADIQPAERKSGSFDLEKVFPVIPEETYSVDFLYVSKIAYADGTEWTDPFGLKVF